MSEAIPIDGDGRFAGYASVFHKLDDGGDIVMPGAFRKSLGLRGRHRVKMLFQHDPKEPVGTWDAVREDDFGLWVEGRLVPEVPRADALRRLIAKGAVDGLGTRQGFESDARGQAISHSVVMRFRTDLKPGDRISYRGGDLTIEGTNDISGRRAYLACQCSERVVTG